jgi:excisionase family DNA binding protein
MTSLTVKQVARELGLGLSTVYDMVHAGELPAFRCGRAIRIDAAGVATWRDHNAVRPAVPVARSEHFK